MRRLTGRKQLICWPPIEKSHAKHLDLLPFSAMFFLADKIRKLTWFVFFGKGSRREKGGGFTPDPPLESEGGGVCCPHLGSRKKNCSLRLGHSGREGVLEWLPRLVNAPEVQSVLKKTHTRGMRNGDVSPPHLTSSEPLGFEYPRKETPQKKYKRKLHDPEKR